MLLLVHKAHETLLRYQHPNVGRLVSPRHFGRIKDTPRAGMMWAADNDAYAAWNPDKFRRMLGAIEGVPACLFVSCPDVVADADATFNLFLRWGKEVLSTGQPLGYVIQDGATIKGLPWNALKAVFIGGTSGWKFSSQVVEIVQEAKDRGKWVHMGRVNTWRRIEYAKSIGVDSVDGSQLSMFTDTYLSRFSEMAAAPTQMAFGGTWTPPLE